MTHREGTSNSCCKPKECAGVQSSRKCACSSAAEGDCPPLPYTHCSQLQKDSDLSALQPCLQLLTPAELCVSLIRIPNSWMWKRDKLLVILSVLSSDVVQESRFIWEYHIVKQEGVDTFQSVTWLFSSLSLCTAGQSFDCDRSEMMVWGVGEQKEKHCQIWKPSFKPACSSWGVFRDMRHYTSLHREYQSSTAEYMKGKSLVKQTVGNFLLIKAWSQYSLHVCMWLPNDLSWWTPISPLLRERSG